MESLKENKLRGSDLLGFVHRSEISAGMTLAVASIPVGVSEEEEPSEELCDDRAEMP